MVNTFPAEIHVAAGDVIGLNTRETSTAPNGCVFSTGNGLDVYGLLSPGLDVGETGTFTADSEFRVNVVATLAAEPVTNAVSPSRGPASGGTEVVIAGHDLTGARQVNFGSAFAAFSVESDNAIRGRLARRHGDRRCHRHDRGREVGEGRGRQIHLHRRTGL